jgi:hypothetical protein
MDKCLNGEEHQRGVKLIQETRYDENLMSYHATFPVVYCKKCGKPME